MLTQILQMASWATAIFQQDEPERYCAHGWESALAAFDRAGQLTAGPRL
jgi:hypothetical protein